MSIYVIMGLESDIVSISGWGRCVGKQVDATSADCYKTITIYKESHNSRSYAQPSYSFCGLF